MKAVAATLFEEGAVTLVYVVLVNCKSMLERWSNSYGEYSIACPLCCRTNGLTVLIQYLHVWEMLSNRV